MELGSVWGGKGREGAITKQKQCQGKGDFVKSQYSELLLTSNNMKQEQVLAELLGCLSGALWGQSGKQ